MSGRRSPGGQRAHQTPSAPVVWEVHHRPVPLFDEGFEGPAHMVLCVDRSSGLILAGELVPGHAAPEATVAAVLKAMRTCRPDLIAVQRPDLVDRIAEALRHAGEGGVEVRLVRSLPTLRQVLREVGERLGFDPDALARYWKDISRSYPDMKGLMADVAAFYRAAPWDCLGEGALIRGELHGLHADRAPRVRYLAVPGESHPLFGLVAFSTLAGARSTLGSGLVRRLERVAALYVTFTELGELDDALALQLASRYEVADPAAYPFFGKQGAGGRPMSLEIDDFDELRAWLVAVRALVESEPEKDKTARGSRRRASKKVRRAPPPALSLTASVRGQELTVRLSAEEPVPPSARASSPSGKGAHAPEPGPDVRRPGCRPAEPEGDSSPPEPGADEPPVEQLSLFEDLK